MITFLGWTMTNFVFRMCRMLLYYSNRYLSITKNVIDKST
jgi:hypothetical protein